MGRILRQAVGIGPDGDIRQGSLFSTLVEGATKFMDWLGKMQPVMDTVVHFFESNSAAAAALAGVLGGVVMLPIIAIVMAIGWIPLAIAGAVAVIGGLIGWLMTEFNKPHSAIKAIADVIGNVLGPPLQKLWTDITTKLVPAFERLWKFVSPVLIPALKIIGMLIGGVVVGAVYLLIGAVTLLVDWYSFLWDSFVNIGQAIGSFVSDVGTIGKAIGDLFSGGDPTLPANKMTGAWQGFGKTLAWIHDRALDFVDFFNTAIEKIKNDWNAGIKWIADTWNNTITSIKNVWNSVVNGIATGFTNAVNGVIRGLLYLKDHFFEVIGFLIGFIISLPFKIVNAFVMLSVFIESAVVNALLAVYNAIAEGISKAVHFISSIDWGQVWNFLVNAVGVAVTNVWNSITSTIAGVINWIASINWSAIWNGLVNAVTGAAASVWNSITGTIGQVINWVAHIDWWGALSGIGKAIGDAAGQIWDAISGVFNRVMGLDWGGILVGIGKGIGNAIIDLINGALKGAFSGIPGLKDHVPQIPRFARGVKNFSGGLALVGEEGPELVNLARGTQVRSASDTRQALAGSGRQVTVNIGVVNNQSDGDTDRLLRAIGMRLAI